MSDFDDFCGHTITVKTRTGSTGMGDTFATPVTYAPATNDGVLVTQGRKLVRDATGSEVISETTIYDPEPTHATAYTPGSLIDLPDSTTATVILAKPWTAPGLELPESVEVDLT